MWAHGKAERSGHLPCQKLRLIEAALANTRGMEGHGHDEIDPRRVSFPGLDHHLAQRADERAHAPELQGMNGFTEGVLVDTGCPRSGEHIRSTPARDAGGAEFRRTAERPPAFLTDRGNDQPEPAPAGATERKLPRVPAHVTERWKEEIRERPEQRHMRRLGPRAAAHNGPERPIPETARGRPGWVSPFRGAARNDYFEMVSLSA